MTTAHPPDAMLEVARARVRLRREAQRAEQERVSDEPSGCDEHPTREAERAAVAADFAHFLPRWHFKNREAQPGEPTILTFANLWPGQARVVEVIRAHRWCFLLKAGKLGFTELECAYDGWVALYRNANVRVNIFSKDATASKELLKAVKFGIQHMPPWLGLPIMDNEPGGDTTTQLSLYGGIDDTRRVVAFAASPDAAIDVSASHSHVDELARMPWPAQTWSSVESTVAPGGTAHIVTRGAGDGNYTTELWYKAKEGASPLFCHFEPYDARPRTPEREVPEGADPTEVWYAEREAGMLPHELNWLAPRTEEDALKGSSEGAFVSEPQWLACYDPDLPPLIPGDGTPIVLSMDAGVSSDNFAITAVSRHPQREADPAVRAVRVFQPPKGGQIDFDEVEEWVRLVCMGGCVNGHANAQGRLSAGQMCAEHPTLHYRHKVGPMATCSGEPQPCEACAAGTRVARHNVVTIAYDSYQLVDMAQRLSRDRIAWCYSFSQGTERMEADANLRLLIMQRRLAHRGDAVLTQHVMNANALVPKNEETKLRLVKRNPGSKIDAAVSLSMSVARCLYLVLHATSSPA